VAGRYQPLADDVTIAGDVRPNLSSAVNQKTKEIGLAFESDFLRLRRRYSASLLRSAATPPNSLHLPSEIDGLCPRFPGNCSGQK